MPVSLLAIDWGTTAARVYALDERGEIVEQRSRPLGITQVREGRFPQALDELLGDLRHLQVPRLACGMIGSRQGWLEAPYVACPAALETLAAGIVTTSDRSLSIVPGLITRDARGTPDVMRGEETQLLGAVAPSEDRVIAVLPGTHSKWAIVERGVVVRFITFMTGELYAVLLAHSLLGRLVQPSPTEPTSTQELCGPFQRGLEHGLQPGGLSHDLFAARTLALTGDLEPSEIADWLSGLLIGREIRDAAEWSGGATPVRVIGERSLAARYIFALEFAGITVEQRETSHSMDAAARGLWRIANQADLV